jgi:hypothetical protein
MAIERGGIELRQNINPLDLRIDAIADGNIDQAILGGERNRWLGAQFGQGIEPGSGASTQNDRQYSFHKASVKVPLVCAKSMHPTLVVSTQEHQKSSTKLVASFEQSWS